MIDDKFIDDFVNDANLISSNNKFIYTFSSPAKHVKSKKEGFAPYHSKELKKIQQSIKKNDRLFVHWFTPNVLDFIDQLPKETKVYLFFWGGDFLEVPAFSKPNNKLNHFLFGAKTLSYFQKDQNANFKQFKKNRLEAAILTKSHKNILATWFDNQLISVKRWRNSSYSEAMEIRRRFLQRIEAICHWNKFDIEFLNVLYDVKLRQLPFVYNIGLNSFSGMNKESSKKSTLKIWLGNSDTPTNNHLDAFDILEKLKHQNIEIICPLNYGNIQYAKLISAEGKRMFGEKFKPLLGYIPRDEYYDLMDTVDVAYMPHRRGQAGGNIIAFIKKGVRIVMNDQSSIYKLFDFYGISIQTEDWLKEVKFNHLQEPLDETTKQKNITVLNSQTANEENRIKSLKAILVQTNKI